MFERDGFDVHSDVHISFTQAVLGGEVKTPALSGPIVVKVWSFFAWFSTSVDPVVLVLAASRFQLGLHHTTRYDWPTGESPDSIAMATETTTRTSRS